LGVHFRGTCVLVVANSSIAKTHEFRLTERGGIQYGCSVKDESDLIADNQPVAAGSEYVVVSRAQSSAHFAAGDGCEFNLDAIPELGKGPIRVRIFTRWATSGEISLPRELIIEIRGGAGSLDEAATKFGMIARPFATMVGFVANVRVGPVEVHLAYECADGQAERQFLETFIADEQGAMGEGRLVDKSLMIETCNAFHTLEIDIPRVSRGLRQYELALRQWYLGGEWLALSHLYMAVEALTKAVIRKTIADRGIRKEELAQSFHLVTDDPERPRWREYLDQQVREQLIFRGDSETYKTAKNASDGLEHGSWDLDKIAEHAVKCADKTFHYVRQTVLELLNLPPEVAEKLMAIKPKDVQSRRKVVRGRLIGAVDDPAAADQMYPILEWKSAPSSVVHEGSSIRTDDSEKIIVRTHPDVSFKFERLDVFGRLEDGQVPVEISAMNLLVEPTPEPESGRMLGAVMPVVDAAAASGADTAQTRLHMFAFNLFGQGVAFFQSAQTLLNSFQPVEALPALRGLTIIAARFEQMAADDGFGLGIVVRLVINALDEVAVNNDVAVTRRDELLLEAEQAGLVIPDELAGPETSAVYVSLTAEMALAQSVVDGTYGTIGLHVKLADDQHLGFNTRLEPGHFTEMVASACVIAQLELLKRAAKLFGWTIDDSQLDVLLRDARELNETSALGGNSAAAPD